MPVLRLGHLGPVDFALGEVDGHAEQAVDPLDPALSAYLLAQNVTRLPQGVTLASLPVALLHRLYWAIHRSLYSGPAESQARCSDCADEFEFSLDLETIAEAQEVEAARAPALQDGWWPLPSGGRLRPPRHADLAAGSLGALLDGLTEGDVDHDEADAFLDRAAPLLDFDLETACPHCGASHELRFSMPQYLALKLHGERPFLLREVHMIANQYTWGHAEILALKRSDRRAFAALIQSERMHAQRRRLQAVS